MEDNNNNTNINSKDRIRYVNKEIIEIQNRIIQGKYTDTTLAKKKLQIKLKKALEKKRRFNNNNIGRRGNPMKVNKYEEKDWEDNNNDNDDNTSNNNDSNDENLENDEERNNTKDNKQWIMTKKKRLMNVTKII